MTDYTRRGFFSAAGAGGAGFLLGNQSSASAQDQDQPSLEDVVRDAMQHQDKGEFAKSVKVLENAKQWYGKNLNLHVELAKAYCWAEDVDKGIDAFETAEKLTGSAGQKISLRWGKEQIHRFFAVKRSEHLILNRKDPEKAKHYAELTITHCDEGLKLMPDHAGFYAMSAAAKFRGLKDYQGAIRDYEKAIIYNAGSDQLKKSLFIALYRAKFPHKLYDIIENLKVFKEEPFMEAAHKALLESRFFAQGFLSVDETDEDVVKEYTRLFHDIGEATAKKDKLYALLYHGIEATLANKPELFTKKYVEYAEKDKLIKGSKPSSFYETSTKVFKLKHTDSVKKAIKAFEEKKDY